ncbi:WXG100 family type VII secretion target [Streptomyces lydicus]|uniref:WXG100 family type VII secretion target n=1 Tax=Streptomyces lydicus TaxID=47763 RepID=UPI0036E9D618
MNSAQTAGFTVQTAGAAGASTAAPQSQAGAGKDSVKVTPDMITKFAGMLREAASPLSESENNLAAVNGVRAGWFPDGEDIRKFIGSGRDGRVRDIMQNAATVRDQLRTVADKLDEVAHRYQSTEELNQHLVEDLAPILGSFNSTLTSMPSPSTASVSVPASASDGGAMSSGTMPNPGGAASLSATDMTTA